MQLKLNELLAANERASNRMIGIELLDESQVRELYERFQRLAEKAKNESGGHTIEEIPADENSTLGWMRDPND